MSKLFEEVKIANIIDPVHALRDAQTQSAEYEGLRRSIEQSGVLASITLKPSTTEPGKYEIIDGLQRTTICRELGIEKIPAQILDANEQQTLSIQIQSNLHVVRTKPAEFSNQIKRLMSLDQTLTEAKLATQLGVDLKWLQVRVGLVNLLPSIKDLVDNGTILLTNAAKLAKLPEEEQAAFVDRAVQMPTKDFLGEVDTRLGEIRKAIAEGKKVSGETYVPQAAARSRADIQTEALNHAARSVNVTEGMTGIDGWDAALKWVLSMDDATLAAKRADWEAKKAAREQRQKEREAAREAAKAAKGASAADAVAAALTS